jgi:hypothetical protein
VGAGQFSGFTSRWTTDGLPRDEVVEERLDELLHVLGLGLVDSLEDPLGRFLDASLDLLVTHFFFS